MNGVGVELAQGFFEGTGTRRIRELLDSWVPPCWASPFWQSPGWPAPQKEPGLAPASGPALRYGFVFSAAAPRVAVQGPSMALYGGTPSSLAAFMPLAPLHDGSVHPPEGAMGSRWVGRASRTMNWLELPRVRGSLIGQTTFPSPPANCPIFGYFFPGRAGASGKSDTPSRAKQKLSTSSKNGSGVQSTLKTGHISSTPPPESPKTHSSNPSPNFLSQNRHIPPLPSAAVPGWTR